MAIIISDNYDYKGKLPDFDRQEYATIADMKAVKKAKMPEMYIGYCLEDHKVYLYNKNNENDDTLGYWREFGAGGSSESIQVTALPTANESQVGKVYQYIGNSTLTEITGYFYVGIVASEDTQTVDITTLSDLKTTISESEISMEVYTGEATESLNTYVFDGKYYYVVNDVVYVTTNTSGDTSIDTPIETDEDVVSQNLTKEVTVYTYGWQQLNVQPGGSGGASTASDVSYSNLDYPALDNVEKALNNILGKIYYVEPKINSFTMTPSTTEYEIGASVSDLVFNWTTNKEITTQTLTDCTLADATVRTATAAGPYTSNKTFTLSIGDGENTATSSKSISFKHKVYWGSSAEPNGAYDSAFILGLSNKKFATNYKGTYSMTVAQDQFGYLAYPSSWGTVTSWFVGGFEVTVHDCGEVSFTNASGNTTTFRVIRTTQPSLGAISPEIK